MSAQHVARAQICNIELAKSQHATSDPPARCPATPTSCADWLELLPFGEQVHWLRCLSFVTHQMSTACVLSLPHLSLLTRTGASEARSFEHAGRGWATAVPEDRGGCSSKL